MLQEWLGLDDAGWAEWTRASSEGVLWAFGVPAAVILAGLALFAWGASRRRWKAIVAGLVLVVPAAMLTAVFLKTEVQTRARHAWCAAGGRAETLGRNACAAGGEATLIRVVVGDDGFPRTQYYWTSDGLCEAEVARDCRARAQAVDRVPTPGMEPVVHAGF